MEDEKRHESDGRWWKCSNRLGGSSGNCQARNVAITVSTCIGSVVLSDIDSPAARNKRKN